MRKNILIGLAVAALSTTSANAATISYVLEGTSSGTLNGVQFGDRAVRFSGNGDTELVVNDNGVLRNALSASVSVDGFGTFAITDPFEVTRTSDGTVSFADLTFFTFAFRLPAGAAGASYDLRSNISLSGLGENGNFRGNTSGGLLSLNGVDVQNTVSFSALTSAVPEPATWAMLLIGFGMVGAASRYRRRSTVTTFA